MKLLNIVALNFAICLSFQAVAHPMLPDMSASAGSSLGSMGMDQSYGPTELVALAAAAARLGGPVMGGDPAPDLMADFHMVPGLPFWARAMNMLDNRVILPLVNRVKAALPAGFFASYLTQPAMAALTRHRRAIFFATAGVAVVAVGGASHFVILGATGVIFVVSASGNGVVSAGKWLMGKDTSEPKRA